MIDSQQLADCGVSRSTVSRWRAAGKLHLIHCAVYALGHPSIPIEGRLVAALLHAGPGACLSHDTAAWWWGLIKEEPKLIDVSTPTRARSVPGVRVHHPRKLEQTRHRRFPITTVARTVADLAARSSYSRLRRLLAEADYKQLLDVAAIRRQLGRGRRGTTKLRRGLDRHEPRLALARSKLEQAFILLCERGGLEMPQINARIDGMTVDALWPAQRVVVEIDGYGGHHTRAQIERDRARELRLRAAGFVVFRYSEWQIINDTARVIADLRAALGLAAAA